MRHPALAQLLLGKVIAFDPDGGWGRIQLDLPDDEEDSMASGSVREPGDNQPTSGAPDLERPTDTYPFHCTGIADGSRSIELGARVCVVLAPGRSGLWEATGVTKIPNP